MIYYLSLFPPKSVAYNIEKLQRDFCGEILEKNLNFIWLIGDRFVTQFREAVWVLEIGSV